MRCRVALSIIFFCGGVQSFFRVSSRIFSHSGQEGKRRFSGRAFHNADRSASRNSARPRRLSFCLRVSHSRSDGTR